MGRPAISVRFRKRSNHPRLYIDPRSQEWRRTHLGSQPSPLQWLIPVTHNTHRAPLLSGTTNPTPPLPHRPTPPIRVIRTVEPTTPHTLDRRTPTRAAMSTTTPAPPFRRRRRGGQQPILRHLPYLTDGIGVTLLVSPFSTPPTNIHPRLP